jgi:ATP-dependent helicase/DNAse subunit B
LETFACCPVRWFVEYLLRPQRLEPPPEPLVCGRLIHAVLKDVLEGLRRQTGSARLSASRLEQARSLMRGAVERRCTQQPLSVLPEQHAAVRRRVEADLGRYLEHAVGQQGVLESAHLELQFGFEDDSGDGELNNGHPAAVKSVPDARPTRVPGAHEHALPALELAEGVRVRGRIDRIDVGPSGQAVVYDYKPRAAGGSPGQKWLSGRSLQVALYMRACRDLLGLEPVGGFYQPVTGQDLRARGALAEEVEAPCMKGDRYDRGALEAMIENAIGLARDAAAEAAAGELQARPQTCSVAGKGCMYPTICRCGASAC